MKNDIENKSYFLTDIIMNKCLMFKTNFDKINFNTIDENLQKEIKFFNTDNNYLSIENADEELDLKKKVNFSFQNNVLNRNKLECIRFTNNLLQKYVNRTNKISNLNNSELVNYFTKENQINIEISKNNVASGLNMNSWNFGYNVMLIDAYDCMTKEKYNLNALDNRFKDFKNKGS